MHSFSKVLTHFLHFGARSRWRISQTNVCSMLRKIRFLDFTSGSSLATSFQKRKNALFPLRSAFTLAGYRLRLSPYAKSASWILLELRFVALRFKFLFFKFAKRHAKTSFLTLPAPFQKVINLFQRATLLRQSSAPVALRALPYVLRKIRCLGFC